MLSSWKQERETGRNVHLLKITQVLSIIPFTLPLTAWLAVSPFNKHQGHTETILSLPPYGLFSTGENELSALPASTVCLWRTSSLHSGFFPQLFIPNKLTSDFPVSIINGTYPSQLTDLLCAIYQDTSCLLEIFNSLAPGMNVSLLLCTELLVTCLQTCPWLLSFYRARVLPVTTHISISLKSLRSVLTNSPLNMSHRNLNTPKTHSWPYLANLPVLHRLPGLSRCWRSCY